MIIIIIMMMIIIMIIIIMIIMIIIIIIIIIIIAINRNLIFLQSPGWYMVQDPHMIKNLNKSHDVI